MKLWMIGEADDVTNWGQYDNDRTYGFSCTGPPGSKFGGFLWNWYGSYNITPCRAHVISQPL